MLLEQAAEKDTLIIDVSYGSNIVFLQEMYCIFNGMSYLKLSSAYGLLYCNMNPFLSSYEQWLQRLHHSFQHIAVLLNGGNKLEKEFLAYAAKEPALICQTYEKEELYLTERGDFISVNGLKENPEIIISFQLTEPVFCAEFGEREIPYLLFCSFFDSWNFCDYDIACNIIPELRQNGVKVLAFSIPGEDEVLSRDEQAVLRERTELLKLEKASEAERIAFYEFVGYGMWNNRFFKECCRMTANRFQFGFLDPINYQGDYFNCLSGCRYTAGISAEWEKRIFMFGPCTVRGLYVRDEDTIASVLQRKIGARYCVLNLGSYFPGMNHKIRQYGYQPGDIVVVCVQDRKIYKAKGIEVLELAGVYRELSDIISFVWDQVYHINKYLSGKIAEFLYQNLELDEKTTEATKEKDEVCLSDKKTGLEAELLIGNQEFKSWLSGLEKQKKGLIGAIVMNCNPFTNGHRYLIERALEQVDFLYIFVVQEDRSCFSFHERIKLVREGTKDLKNLLVYPSGRFMISSVTLPGYFEKEALQDVNIDASKDVTLFARVIAPLLNIKVRFVGEEPIDQFTNKYNRTMELLLPVYGIRLVQIPRLEINGQVISASRVRRCLDRNRIEEVKDIVPKSTYRFLKKRQGKGLE